MSNLETSYISCVSRSASIKIAFSAEQNYSLDAYQSSATKGHSGLVCETLILTERDHQSSLTALPNPARDVEQPGLYDEEQRDPLVE